MEQNSYAAAGVDTEKIDHGLKGLINELKKIDTGTPSRSVLPSGHYAAVITVAPNLGIAITTDGVGSKLILANTEEHYRNVAIDCIAMSVNDIICIGAKPIALVDYIAVETINPAALKAIGEGLRTGAEEAQIEIPAGELAVLPELIQGHPSPNGFDLVGTCIGTIALDQIITGETCQPGDTVVGIPSSGLHSNGYTLARKALLRDGQLTLDDTPPELEGSSLQETLLTPTTIYVRAILELLDKEIPIKGMAHITGGGITNLKRLNPKTGFQISTPLPIPPIFHLIQETGSISDQEMWEVFNMGCGFCVIVPNETTEAMLTTLTKHHPGTAAIGTVTDQPGSLTVSDETVRFT